MRCLVVSFRVLSRAIACYRLWLHCRRPAVWLARRFVDFAPGISTLLAVLNAGRHTAEYMELRVSNPIKQAKDQDPNDGTFIRKWLPELRVVPRYSSEPHKMPAALQRQKLCVLVTKLV
jgi:deoxyribodipyrimidine photo-lyase